MYILEAKNGAGREAVDLVDLSAAPGPRSGSAPAVDLVAPALARPRQRPVPPLAYPSVPLSPPVTPSVFFPPGGSHGGRCALPPVVAPLHPVDRPPAVDAVDLVEREVVLQRQSERGKTDDLPFANPEALVVLEEHTV